MHKESLFRLVSAVYEFHYTLTSVLILKDFSFDFLVVGLNAHLSSLSLPEDPFVDFVRCNGQKRLDLHKVFHFSGMQ